MFEKKPRKVLMRKTARSSYTNCVFTAIRVQNENLSWRKIRALARGVSPAPKARGRGPLGRGGGDFAREREENLLFDPVYARICVKKDLGKPTQSSHISYIIHT